MTVLPIESYDWMWFRAISISWGWNTLSTTVWRLPFSTRSANSSRVTKHMWPSSKSLKAIPDTFYNDVIKKKIKQKCYSLQIGTSDKCILRWQVRSKIHSCLNTAAWVPSRPFSRCKNLPISSLSKHSFS